LSFNATPACTTIPIPRFSLFNHGNASNLVLLHQTLELLDIFTIAADRRIVGDKFLNVCGRWAQSVRQHAATQIRIRENANKMPTSARDCDQ
jgi:hypothetical protein